MKSRSVYVCDCCNRTFQTEDECIEHERSIQDEKQWLESNPPKAKIGDWVKTDKGVFSINDVDVWGLPEAPFRKYRVCFGGDTMYIGESEMEIYLTREDFAFNGKLAKEKADSIRWNFPDSKIEHSFDISGGRIGIRPIPCSQVIFDDRQIVLFL